MVDPKAYHKNWYEQNKEKRRLKTIWFSMIQRCKDKNNKYYGKKGIKVCDEWLDYSVFEKWANENGYSKELSLDRIDSNSDYCPQNCRWADHYVQMRNRSYTRMITYNNETHCLSEWSEITGISKNALFNRMRRGWDVERALTQKQNPYNKGEKS